MLPMLATKGRHVPGQTALGQGTPARAAEQWVHEVKWDGVRILADSAGAGAVRLSSRNANDVTVAWPDVVADIGRDLLVDGEVISLDAEGRPSFAVVAERLHVHSRARAARLAAAVPATYMVFDLMRLDGRDLTRLPWQERRALLEGLDLGDTGWQVPPTYDDGPMLFEATREQGLEGIVSKRAGSRYEPGVRSRDWLKFAHRVRTSVVVGGWRPQEGTADRLAALLVGEPATDGLRYRGRVGSGIGGAASRALRARFAGRTLVSSPFVDEVPRVDATGTTWVEPFLVVEVESLGRSRMGRLRQPSYQGVREDLSPDDLALSSTSSEGGE